MTKPAIDLESDIRLVSEFRAKAAATLAHLHESGRAVVLTQRGRSAAVPLGVSTYQALLDELEELRDVQRGLADLDADRVLAHDDAKASLLTTFND